VQSRMLHGNETWPVTKENDVALQQAELKMVNRCVMLRYMIVPS